jgi:hypothetical protein|tara:strand:- start:4290 stop:4916 length:627 start_codon:yes stop_codon:yes gene_type:complete
MKILSINTKQVPLGTQVNIWFDTADVDVLSALAHIATMTIGSSSSGGGHVIPSDSIKEAMAAQDAPAFCDEAMSEDCAVAPTVEQPEEPKKPTRTRSRGGRSKPAEDVGDEQSKKTKKPARKRSVRSAGASDGAGDDSDAGSVDAGAEKLTLSDLSKAASEAAMVITPAGVAECLEALGVRLVNDLKPEHYARFMSTLAAEVAKEEGE